MYHVYFEDELLNLRKELCNHADLQIILRLQPIQDIYIHLAEIAAYLGVAINGTFTQSEVLDLCDMFTKLLVAKRTIFI
jgi:hypothetical protein